MIAALLSGAALGLVAGGHCVAMCGPLVALARPAWPRDAMVYHAGRIAIYAGIGLVAGAWGRTASAAGLGRPLAFGAGLVLLVYAAVELGIAGRITARAPGSRAVTSAVARAGRWLHQHRRRGPFAAGVLNGLLPCGLVYAAAAGAAGLGDVPAALAFMAGFGAGTTPALAAVGVSIGLVPPSFFPLLRRATPAALVLVALMLFARGAAPHDAPAAASASVHSHP